MEKRDFCDYQVAFNERATKSWYEKSGGWGCGCGHCRNFRTLARRRELPAPMLKLLDEPGDSTGKSHLCLRCVPGRRWALLSGQLSDGGKYPQGRRKKIHDAKLGRRLLLA